ncbi:1-acylglycerol-3-phosphate O-acyltransferase [Synchytrium microbalum]|uniref:1-acylglycerol-3-phosphate O-acyltransferase n=1 Tax=Synchytrium microbalum TaxID=1806994 RepID=A0A507CK14_9FUNG|nr:1-acylglycerol-3-phosphate O-acyltransferase [Synchytrium microbalum]TPX38133.1 1-acylglycerol-3-phosphate O-acyltransferase [Synchytrium microbalum]
MQMLSTLRIVVLLVGLCTPTIVLNVLQFVSLAMMPFAPKTTAAFNCLCAWFVWRVLQEIFERLDRAKVTFSGDHLPDGENALIISNHVGFSDFFLIHTQAYRRKMLGNCKYFAKDSLKWIPLFGWGMWAMGMPFMARNWLSDSKTIAKVFANIKDLELPVWLISYLEGTRFTAEKVPESHAFAKDKGLPQLDRVLLPRTKGFIATVNAFRKSHVKHVYDFTIVYKHVTKGLQHSPSLLRVFAGSLDREYKFHVHVKRYALDSLPTDPEKLTQWAMERYQEKDVLLKGMAESWTDKLTLRVDTWPTDLVST